MWFPLRLPVLWKPKSSSWGKGHQDKSLYLAGRTALNCICALFGSRACHVSQMYLAFRGIFSQRATVPFIQLNPKTCTYKCCNEELCWQTPETFWNLLIVERYSEFGLRDSHMPSTLRHSSLRHKMARQMCCWCLTHRWWTRRPVRSWESALRTAHDCDTAWLGL